MLYENGKPKAEKLGDGKIDLAQVEKLLKDSNSELLSSLVKQMKLMPAGTLTSSVQQEDFSKDTMLNLAKMMGKKRHDEEIKELGTRSEIKSDIKQDQQTIDLLRSLE